VRVEVGRRQERGAVEALHHRVLLVAAEIRAGDGRQLEGLDRAGARHVGPAAQVGEVAAVVQADRLALGDVRQALQLVLLAALGHHVPDFRAGLFLAHEGGVFGDDLGHFGLDRGEILGRQAVLQVEIVVETVVRVRADVEEGIGPQAAHRGRHHVRRAVAHRFQTVVIRLHGTGQNPS